VSHNQWLDISYRRRGMAIDLKAIADILDAIAWPLVVGITLFVSRKPLAKLVAEIGKRITKLSIGEYEIELSIMPEMAAKTVANFDVRQLSPTKVFDSGSQELFKQLAAPRQADYAIIDLGEGKKWLSSRLYIFALILGRVSGLKSFVFVETRNGVTRSLVGSASPLLIGKSLAKRYPWLESAFNIVYASIAPDPKTSNTPYELKELADENPWQISELVKKYIAEIQQQVEPNLDSRDEWESFGDPIHTWERTSWLEGRHIEELLGSDLCTSSITDSPDDDSQAKVKAILRRTGEYVALTDDKERFKHLVDRSALLEKLARTVE
jgi:hypothetical protein